MKKFIYSIFVITALVGGLCSCNSSFLDTKPTNAVPASEAMTNVADAGVACNGLYTPLKYYTMYSTYFAVLGDMRSDVLYPAKNNQGFKTVYNLQFDKVQNTYFGSIWMGYYEVINRCNTYLENIGPLYDKSSSKDQAIINDYIGQCYAVRGLCYFDLARFYGYPYAKDNGASLGAVILTNTISASEAKEMSRSTVAQTYERAIADFGEAVGRLSKDKNSGHFNYWAAKAMLAKIQLYMGDNTGALANCKEVINSGVYSLVSRDGYIDYWGHENQPETVLEFLISLKGDIDDDGGFYTIYHDLHFSKNNADNDGHCIVPTKKYRESLGENDIRRTMLKEYILTNAQGEDYVQEIWLNKFPGNLDKGFTFRRNNAKVLRMSDVYLMAAEAAVKGAGTKEEAANYLYAVASRRDSDAQKLANPTLDDILLERFKEFPAEGQRFFDMLRNGKTITHDMSYDPEDGVALTYPEVNWDKHIVVLPIAESEIAIHSNLQQNPGY